MAQHDECPFLTLKSLHPTVHCTQCTILLDRMLKVFKAKLYHRWEIPGSCLEILRQDSSWESPAARELIIIGGVKQLLFSYWSIQNKHCHSLVLRYVLFSHWSIQNKQGHSLAQRDVYSPLIGPNIRIFLLILH